MSGDINLNDEADLIEKLVDNPRFIVELPKAEERWMILMLCFGRQPHFYSQWMNIFGCKSTMEKVVALTEGLSSSKIEQAIDGVSRHVRKTRAYVTLRDLTVAIKCQRSDSVP